MTVITIKRTEQMDRELQEKSKWVRDILSKIGLPVEEWSETLSMDDIRRIRAELKQLDLDIIDDSNAGLEIYFQGDLIASWLKPTYVLVQNPRERDPKNRYNLQMHINCKSVFDEEAEKQENKK